MMGEFEAVMAFYPKSEPPVWVKNLNKKRFENFDTETEEEAVSYTHLTLPTKRIV